MAQDEAGDELLSSDPFALLVGMLLDQQFPMERAFAGPAKGKERVGSLDPAEIAAADPEAFADLCATPPAVHRYGRSMAGRIQAVAAVVRDEYEGDITRLWSTAGDTQETLRRLKALPGFGDQKARIFAALLGKQLGVQPEGWREAIGPYAEHGSRRQRPQSSPDRADPETVGSTARSCAPVGSGGGVPPHAGHKGLKSHQLHSREVFGRQSPVSVARSMAAHTAWTLRSRARRSPSWGT